MVRAKSDFTPSDINRVGRENVGAGQIDGRHSGMRLLAQTRNPYSQSWLWIPGSLVSLAPRNDENCFANRVALRHPISEMRKT